MRMKMISIALVSLLFSTFAAAEELLVAAAADLQFAFQEIAARFEKETGNKVNVSYGSSGNFFNLIQNGAPYDLFFSADIDYPRKLEAAGRTVPGSLYEYASGKLVLWTPRNSPLDLSRGLEVLVDPRIKKIAIANPLHAPYGRAALSAMQSAGLYDRLKEKLVTGENISQTAEFVQTGNADIGFVALSLALSPTMKSKGKFVEVPTTAYPPIRQAVVVLKSSKHQALARQFVDYVMQPQSSEILRQYGFVIPTATTK
jgi:molybdate transport system substrate-binding protein